MGFLAGIFAGALAGAMFLAGCAAPVAPPDTTIPGTAETYSERRDEILSDTQEIEKKWLVREADIPYDLTQAAVYRIEQTYIHFSPEIRVRRINGSQHTMAVKANTSGDGMVRDELDIWITEAEYESLLKKRDMDAETIDKTRYQIFDETLGVIVAFDVFHGALHGLCYLEIEFTNIDEANRFGAPDWVVMDVTGREDYKNGSLARYGIPKDAGV